MIMCNLNIYTRILCYPFFLFVFPVRVFVAVRARARVCVCVFVWFFFVVLQGAGCASLGFTDRGVGGEEGGSGGRVQFLYILCVWSKPIALCVKTPHMNYRGS